MTENALEHDFGGARRVIAHEFPRSFRDGEKRAVRADGDAMRLSGVREEFADLSVEIDAVDLVVRRVGKKHLAAGVARRTSGALEAFGNGLPSLPGHQDLLGTGRTGACLHPVGPAFPEVGHAFAVIFHVSGDMASIDDAELVVVAGKRECLVNLLIEQKPIARHIFHVLHPGGHEGADRFCLELANHRRKLMATAEGHKAAARAIHPAEGIRTVPGRRECRDPSAAATGQAAVIAILRQFQAELPGHEREQFLG